MALLLPGLRSLVRRSGGVADRATNAALRAIEDYLDALVRRLSSLEQSTSSGSYSPPIPQSDVTNLTTDLAAKVPTTRTVSTTSPLSGGGALSANLTLAVANNSIATAGVVTTAPNDTTKFWRGDASWAVPAASLPGSLLFGDGADGALTFDGATTVLGIVPSGNEYILTQDISATSITVNASVKIATANYRMFCTGTFTNNGTVGGYGRDAVGSTRGAAWNSGVYPNASGAGGAGIAVAGVGTAGSNATSGPPTLFPTIAAGTGGSSTGQGGKGGTVGASAGGNAGGITTSAQTNGRFTLLTALRGVGDGAAANYTYGSGGGSGALVGSGGGAVSGGGGGGATLSYIGAKTITGTGRFTSKGGNGGNATLGSATGAGGGGGGGGGMMVIAYSTRTGSLTIDAAGGSAGTSVGTGGVATAGAAGITILANMSGDGT